MHGTSALPASSTTFAEPGRARVEAALAAMSPADRLSRFWRLQETAVARSWGLVQRSGLADPRARIDLVIRARYPEWSDAEVDRLLDAICDREDPAVWLDRLRRRADEIAARLAAAEPAADSGPVPDRE
jgi:hypothetical protein